jgi:hypothetical protein
MEVQIEVTQYTAEYGMRTDWEDEHWVKVTIDNGSVAIQANSAGLRSLARHLLTLAQDSVPFGHHWHFDDRNGFEEGSTELIIAKVRNTD